MGLVNIISAPRLPSEASAQATNFRWKKSTGFQQKNLAESALNNATVSTQSVQPLLRLRPIDYAVQLLPSLRFGGTQQNRQFGKELEDQKKIVTLILDVMQGYRDNFTESAERANMEPGQFLMRVVAPQFMPSQTKDILPSASQNLIAYQTGSKTSQDESLTTVHSLLGGLQIFDAWNQYIDETQHYGLISMYDFENLLSFVPAEHLTPEEVGKLAPAKRMLIDAYKNTETPRDWRHSDGAEALAAWALQQKVLEKIIAKAAKGIPFFFILDNSIQYVRDEYNRPIKPRPENNQKMLAMLDYLKRQYKLPIHVVAYPKELARIFHVKMFVSDGKRAIVGGMNLSNHSAANWDGCVGVEGDEVNNFVTQNFLPDWLMANLYKTYRVTSNKTIHNWIENPHRIGRGMVTGFKELLDEFFLATDTTSNPLQPLAEPAVKSLQTVPYEYYLIRSLINEYKRRYPEAKPLPHFETIKHYGAQETIQEYFETRLNAQDIQGVYSEQFIATYRPVLNRLKELYNAGIPVKILHSGSVIDQFPYTRRGAYSLIQEGIPLRFYKEKESTGEKLHSKWTLFQLPNNNYELIIGSANLSAAALQTNTESGAVRGNRDAAIVIRSPLIGHTFRKQFDIDWAYSPPKIPDGYGYYTLPQRIEYRSPYQAYQNNLKQALGREIKGGGK